MPQRKIAVLNGGTVYISGRSFVLRDASEPRKNLPLSDRAENLEDIEKRLKNDILQESVKYGRAGLRCDLLLTRLTLGSVV